MKIDEFKGIVSYLEIGDKVFYHNKNTGEISKCVVEYVYCKDTPRNGVIELFLRYIQKDEVIRLTGEDAKAEAFELFHGDYYLNWRRLIAINLSLDLAFN